MGVFKNIAPKFRIPFQQAVWDVANFWTNPHFGHMLKQRGGVTIWDSSYRIEASKESGSIKWNLRQKQVQDNLGKLRKNNGFALLCPKKIWNIIIQSDISSSGSSSSSSSSSWATKIGITQQEFRIIMILPTNISMNLIHEICWFPLEARWIKAKAIQIFQQQQLAFPVAILDAVDSTGHVWFLYQLKKKSEAGFMTLGG